MTETRLQLRYFEQGFVKNEKITRKKECGGLL